MRKRIKKCNHDIHSLNRTLIVSNFRNMTFPKKLYARCSLCGETFVFIEKNGHYELMSKEVDDVDKQRDES